MSLARHFTSLYVQNMVFDNSPPPAPSTWSQVKAHLPIVLGVGGLLVAFVGMHTGAIAIAAAAAAHVVLALAVVAIGWFRRQRAAS